MDEHVDVVIITALPEELDAVRAVNEGAMEDNWHEEKDSAGFRYYVRQYESTPGGDRIQVAVAEAINMGGVSAAGVATRLVNELRPHCLAMAGICAGRRRKVSLGDVIVADRVYNYDDGKMIAYEDKKQGVRIEDVRNDIRTFNLDARWKQTAKRFLHEEWDVSKLVKNRPLTLRAQENWLLQRLFEQRDGDPDLSRHEDRRARCPKWADVVTRLRRRRLIMKRGLKLTQKGRGLVKEQLLLHPDGIPGDKDFRVHVGPIATGSHVIEDGRVFSRLSKAVRKVLGLEMEAAAIGMIAEIEGVDRMIVAKAVQDHADKEKDDSFRSFAARASAEFLLAFLRRELPPWGVRCVSATSSMATQTATGAGNFSDTKGSDTDRPRCVFDVFLCYNGADKADVKAIGQQLRDQGLRPWLDEWEIQPGTSWQRALESQITQIRSAAVFVGQSGVGPWQHEGIEVFLKDFAQRQCPVIPVLLEHCPETPPLPLFLKNRRWVDFGETDSDPLNLLVWGITGKPQGQAESGPHRETEPEPEKTEEDRRLEALVEQEAELRVRGDDTTVIQEAIGELKRNRRQRHSIERKTWVDPVLGIEFVYIEPGEFMMGPESEEGRGVDEVQHSVTLTQAFWIATKEITQSQFEEFVGVTGHDAGDKWRRSGGPSHPVAYVSWNDAAAFIEWLDRQVEGKIRLPTEAEWEYAARAGTETSMYSPELDDIAWYGGNSGGKSHPVGHKAPNAWSLYDMLGNVWELCSDHWVKDLGEAAVVDPQGPEEGGIRVARGGSWGDLARYVRAASRYRAPPGYRYRYMGFRVCRGQERLAS